MARFLLRSRYPYMMFSNILEKTKPKLKYKAVIADLGDTIMPSAPMINAFQLAFFNTHGLVMTPAKLYKGFGGPKNQQIQDLLLTEFGRAPSDYDVDLVEAEFNHQLIHKYKQYGAHYFPEVIEAMRTFRRNGIMFGCTTGLSNDVIQVINKSLPSERPWPIVHCQRPSATGINEILRMWNVGLRPADRLTYIDCLKIGDSLSDLYEAKTAGIDFIAIVQHRAEVQKVPKEQIIKEFHKHGAVMCVDTVGDIADMFCPWKRHNVK